MTQSVVGGAPEEILYSNFKLYNSGNFYIGHSTSEENYTTLLGISPGVTYVNNKFKANSDAYFQEKLAIGLDVDNQFADKFHVEGSSRFNGSTVFNNSTKITGNNTLEFGATVANKEFSAGKIGYQSFGNFNSLDIVGAGTIAGERSIKLWDKVYTDKLILGDGEGNTGVHANAKLHVNGKIVSKSVIVTTANWADFVFEQDYDLRSYNSLRNFIKDNGHLPNIPKTETVLEHGFEVGEMNAKLLEKIEELTLYVLDLEERLNQLETK